MQTSHPTQIYICGSHCTGKSTLCAAWLRKYPQQYKHISELGRTLMHEMGINRDDLRRSEEVRKKYQHEIALRQCQLEEALEGNAYISDRGIDHLAYCEEYCSTEFRREVQREEHTQRSLKRYKNHGAVVVVLPPTKECFTLDDKERWLPEMDDMRRFTRVLCSILEECNVPYHLMDVVPLEERVAFIERVIKGTQVDYGDGEEMNGEDLSQG